MAGSGPAPKPDNERRRRNAPAHGSERVVLADGELRGPDLTEVCPLIPTVPEIRAAVEAWYLTWRTSPQAALFEDTDWQRLGMLAPLVAAFWADPDTKTLSEIRLNEERLGATLADRLKVRVRVEHPDGAPVVQLATARDRFADRLGPE